VADAPIPKAVLFSAVALAAKPTAVAPLALPFAWQSALLSKFVFGGSAELPDWHPAIAGAAERANAPAAKAHLATNTRCEPRVKWILDMVAPLVAAPVARGHRTTVYPAATPPAIWQRSTSACLDDAANVYGHRFPGPLARFDV
jgi:hypothetical protein